MQTAAFRGSIDMLTPDKSRVLSKNDGLPRKGYVPFNQPGVIDLGIPMICQKEFVAVFHLRGKLRNMVPPMTWPDLGPRHKFTSLRLKGNTEIYRTPKPAKGATHVTGDLAVSLRQTWREPFPIASLS